MIVRRGLSLLAALAAIVALAPLGNGLSAQQNVTGRFRVLIPDFQPADEDTKDKFGKKLAEELRKEIDNLNTHAPVDKDDIKDALSRFKMDMDELTCIRARQLAQQSNYQVVLCATYTEVSNKVFEVTGVQFVDVPTGEVFAVEPFRVEEKQEKQAAAHIIEEFALFTEQARASASCGQYFESQNWGGALQSCDRALALNPGSISVRYVRASVLQKLERLDEALAEIQTVLEAEPFHQNGLMLGGFLASQLDDKELARDYYEQYLALDPNNAGVRMKVAYDLAQEGDPLGGMRIIEVGVAQDSTNIDFYQQLGNFAFAGATQVRQEAALDGGDGLNDEVRDLYRRAIAAYERVFAEKGSEAEPTQVRNVAAAYLQLGETEQAVEFLDGALETHPGEASLWALQADAFQRQGRIPEAIASLRRVEGIDPTYSQLHLRMGTFLIQSDDLEGAVAALETAVANGTSAEAAANQIFATAHRRFIAPQQKNFSKFVVWVTAAKGFDVNARERPRLDFWHGYAIFQRAIIVEKPETLATANRSLPLFRRAITLFRAARPFASQGREISAEQFENFLDAANQYLEIQEALIKRGR